MVQESNVANHVLESSTFFEADHINAKAPLVFALDLDSTLLRLLLVR